MPKVIFLTIFLIILSSCTSGISRISQSPPENTSSESEVTQSPTPTRATIAGLPDWARQVGFDNPKLIGLQTALSYEQIDTTLGSKEFLLVYHTTSDEVEREFSRFFRENSLILTGSLKDHIQLNSSLKEIATNITLSAGATLKKQGVNYDIQIARTPDYFLLWIKTEGKVIQHQENTMKRLHLVPVGLHGGDVKPDGICEYTKLVDESNTEISLPNELIDRVLCEDIKMLSPNSHFIFYNILNPPDKVSSYKLYNIESKVTLILGEEDVAIDGMDCVWHEDSTAIACVIVDQDDFPAMTKLVIWTIDNAGKSLKTQEFMQKSGETIHFNCGGTCYPSKFAFSGDAVTYTGHELIQGDRTFTIQFR